VATYDSSGNWSAGPTLGPGWSNDGLTVSTPWFSLGQNGTVGVGNPFFSGSFGPSSTSLYAGFGYQEGGTIPYGYQDAWNAMSSYYDTGMNWLADQFEPYLGSIFNPTYSDPYSGW
jgi:hypothetical protein